MLSLALIVIFFSVSSCSMRPALDRVRTARVAGGAIAPANPDAVASGEKIETRGDWACPTGTCKFRKISSGSPFRSFAPQACPFCGTKLEK